MLSRENLSKSPLGVKLAPLREKEISPGLLAL